MSVLRRLCEFATLHSLRDLELSSLQSLNSLAWAQVGGHSVIPKSVTTSRIQANFNDIELCEDDHREIDSLGQSPTRYNIPYIASKCYHHLAQYGANR